MSSQGERPSINDMIKEFITFADDEDSPDCKVVEQPEENGTKTNGCTPHRPAVKTPPSSQRASRGGKGIQLGSHLHATPSSSKSRREAYDEDEFKFEESDDDDDKCSLAFSTPSKKRKQSGTPSKASSKWEDWEDKIILKAVLKNGVDKCDWKTVLHDINIRRLESDAPRTAKAVSCHWSTLKSKLID